MNYGVRKPAGFRKALLEPAALSGRARCPGAFAWLPTSPAPAPEAPEEIFIAQNAQAAELGTTEAKGENWGKIFPHTQWDTPPHLGLMRVHVIGTAMQKGLGAGGACTP